MQLTTHSDYALRMLIYLMTHSDRKVSTREIAEAYGISLHHLTKVAKSLTKKGWLLASMGSGGGLQLAPHTSGTKVGDIVRHTENTLDIVECFNTQKNTCTLSPTCRLKSVLYRARAAFFEILDECSVQDLARNPKELKLSIPATPSKRHPATSSQSHPFSRSSSKKRR